MRLVAFTCIFEALSDTCQKFKNRSRKSEVMGLKRTAFFVRRLKKCDFPIPILTTCLQSVIASKRINQFWCAWCQSLAFSKLYMIHIKKSKIDQERAKLWGIEVRFLCTRATFKCTTGCTVCLILQLFMSRHMSPRSLYILEDIYDNQKGDLLRSRAILA